MAYDKPNKAYLKRVNKFNHRSIQQVRTVSYRRRSLHRWPIILSQQTRETAQDHLQPVAILKTPVTLELQRIQAVMSADRCGCASSKPMNVNDSASSTDITSAMVGLIDLTSVKSRLSLSNAIVMVSNQIKSSLRSYLRYVVSASGMSRPAKNLSPVRWRAIALRRMHT